MAVDCQRTAPVLISVIQGGLELAANMKPAHTLRGLVDVTIKAAATLFSLSP